MRRRTRGQNELGQDEPGDDESARDEAQPIDRAEKTERGEQRARLDTPTDCPRALRPAAARAREGRIPLLDGHPDEGDPACDGDRRANHDRRDRERFARIAGQQEQEDRGYRRQGTHGEQWLGQLSSILGRGSMRSGSATCSPPAAIGACARVSMALEARESARSVSSNFLVAFSRWRPS
jgi:hypothetical protein